MVLVLRSSNFGYLYINQRLHERGELDVWHENRIFQAYIDYEIQGITKKLSDRLSKACYNEMLLRYPSQRGFHVR